MIRENINYERYGFMRVVSVSLTTENFMTIPRENEGRIKTAGNPMKNVDNLYFKHVLCRRN